MKENIRRKNNRIKFEHFNQLLIPETLDECGESIPVDEEITIGMARQLGLYGPEQGESGLRKGDAA